jgi:hypothetical protein
MGEEEGCGNKKSDVASLEKKLKLHLLVYMIDFFFFFFFVCFCVCVPLNKSITVEPI